MVFERHHSALIVASVVTVASFVAATAFTQNRLARLDALSSSIETNTVPSIQHLSRAAVRLTRLNQLLEAAFEGPAEERAAALATARREVHALEDDVRQYVDLPPLRGEEDSWAALQTDVAAAVRLVHSTLDEPAPGTAAAAAQRQDLIDDAIDRAVRSVLNTLAFDVHRSEDMARDVRQVRASTLRMIVLLDAVATVVALVAVLIAYRASRRHDQLLHEHSAVLAERVAELDQFAGRVAHDVLSPLGAVSTGLSLIAQSSNDAARAYIDRSQRALQRVQELVQGLLAFARSGARPDPASRCSLDAILATVVADCAGAAVERDVELVVESAAPVQVPCAVGVAASIVQNLVRNAVNYTSGPVRRVVVRTRSIGSWVRLEVEDTGPGIPTELQATIFNPFVRGPETATSGTGLGLATVKRLVEGHGGSIGLQSSPGNGSLFWIQLPSGGPADEPVAPALAGTSAVGDS